MSVFKRANWRSGLTYQRACDQCQTIVVYKEDSLDFRPWFADGFVYCPKCQKPLRHNEKYAINTSVSYADPQGDYSSESLFCVQCGNKFNDGDKFCSQCGSKR